MKTLVYGVSIKGNQHYIVGAPCQDSNSYEPGDNSSDEIKVIAISDGHGGAQYCRSDIGSSLAVKIAKKELYELVLQSKPLLDKIDEESASIDKLFASSFQEGSLTSERAILEDSLNNYKSELNARIEQTKKSIISSWNQAVDEHFMSNAIAISFARIHEARLKEPSKEIGIIKGYINLEKDKISYINRGLEDNVVSRIQSNPRSIYGATLLVAAQYKNHIIILKLGDGDVSIVDSEDKIIFPIKDKEYEMSNITNSICQKNAIDYFDSLYLKKAVKIIMLSTDGVPNSFKNKSDIGELAQNMYENLVEEAKDFKADIKPYIREFSANENSNGDDCTIAMIANEIPEESYEAFVSSEEKDEETSELEKLYSPMFSDYKLDEVYNLEEKKAIFKHEKIDKDNTELLSKRKKIEDELENIESDNNDSILAELEQVKVEIHKKRKEYIKDYISQNKLLLINNTLHNLTLEKEGVVIEKDEQFSVILSSNKNKLELKPITKEYFKALEKGNIESKILFKIEERKKDAN